MEMISLRQSGDPKDMASATHSLPDVSILIYKHTQATSGLVSILGGLGAVRWFGRKRLSPCLRTLTRPFSNNPASTDSWLGIKKMLCIILPNGRTGGSYFLFVHSYTTAIISPYLSGSFTKVGCARGILAFPTLPLPKTEEQLMISEDVSDAISRTVPICS